MQFLLDNWILVLAAVVSGGLLLWPTLVRGGVAGIGGSALSAAQAVQLMNREKAVLIDVREPAEFAAGHAMGARNVPMNTLDSAKGLPTNKGLPLVVLCATGARAPRAVAQLRKAGYATVHTMSGGTAAWREANLPIEKSA